MSALQKLDGTQSLYQPAAGLRARVEDLLSEQARQALALDYDCADVPTVAIRGLGVPCFLHPPRRGSNWQLICPWWVAGIPEERFEERLLMEVARIQQYLGHMLAPLDPSRLN